MKWLSRDVVLVLLGVTATAGVAAAGASLYRALTAVRVLVSAETVGAGALSGIQYEVQERRQTVLQVLAAENSAGRLARGVDARGPEGSSGDAQIAKYGQQLVDVDPSAANRARVAALLDAWRSYMNLRESVIALALAGKLPEAYALEAGPSGVAFAQAAASLQALQQSLSEFSARQEETVRTGLKKAVTELGALAAATILFVVTLIWSRRKQRKLLSLQNRAEQLERERGRILEMAGRYEPLLAILQVLVSVTQKQLPGSAACVSIVQDGHLRDAVGPGLPKAFLESAYQRGSVVRHIDLAVLRNEALAYGLADHWSQEILSSTGSQIGRVDVYLEQPGCLGEAQTTLLEGVAKLAGIIIQHREMYEQLAFQATHDPLTELPNRRVFQDRLEQAILRAQRDGEKVAVLLIDLDRFKQVNDLRGHRVGDALLREVARRVGGCLRKSDTLSRIGGDEFTVLLNPVESVDGAEQALRRIAQALQAPVTILDHKITVSASIGLSVYPDHGEDPATLVRNADLAMYHAKGRGKNGWQTYLPELGATLLRRMSIEKALEGAIENGELELHYQLQTDLKRQLTGVEALVRWNNPELGQVPPLTFIPVAEESGLIIPIGAWVLEQACFKAAAWLKAGIPIGRIAVNISARQLGQSGFTEEVRSALERSGLSPNCLELELTETSLMYSFGDCMHRLQGLRELGVSVAIDDFGTGYSSLSYLQRLPVSRVKIDQSFIQGITDRSKETLPLIQAIVDLAHGLGLTVIAEGVETERQFAALVAAGCNQVQGYLIHRPQAANQVEAAFGQFVPGLGRLGSLRENAETRADAAPVVPR
jgi:diguanylate cyclase (GGDEF)-like protein